MGAATKLVCVGVVTGAHGVKGAVRIKSFTARPEDVASYGPLVDQSGTRPLELRLLGAANRVLVGRFSGVDDRSQAEALRGRHLYLTRAALPPAAEEEYYHADLIGLDVVLIDGVRLGRLRAIHDFGAGDTIEIECLGAAPVMAPFTRAIVPVIDIEGGRIVIDPPPGLLEPIKEDPASPQPPTPAFSGPAGGEAAGQLRPSAGAPWAGREQALSNGAREKEARQV